MVIGERIKLDLSDRVGMNQAFELLNAYKGIPLVYKATLLGIDGVGARFETEPPSSICLSWDSHTIILDDRNTNAIQARVANFDILTGIAELVDLAYVDRGIGHRTMVRVEPEEALPVEVCRGELAIPGDIIDISLTGFGIRTSASEAKSLQLGDIVRANTRMMDQPVSPLGTIINIRKERDSIRLALHFVEDVTIPIVIARYVIHRRAEIHRDVRNIYYATYTSINPNKLT